MQYSKGARVKLSKSGYNFYMDDMNPWWKDYGITNPFEMVFEKVGDSHWTCISHNHKFLHRCVLTTMLRHFEPANEVTKEQLVINKIKALYSKSKNPLVRSWGHV